MKDYNSIVNQAIKRKFVEQHVLTCMTMEMETLLSLGYENDNCPSYDEIENYYSYPEFSGKYYDFNGGSEENKGEILGEIQNRIDTFGEILDYYYEKSEDFASVEKGNFYFKKYQNIEFIVDDLQHDFDLIEELETEPAEILEWWAVSEFLYRNLKSRGYAVLNYGCNYYWGRQCSGQAILLDYSISSICEDIEILDGQKYSWNTEK